MKIFRARIRNRKKINSWCHNHTNGQIPNIIDHINPLTAAIALNSIYFNSPWSANLFTKKNTKKDSFKGENGNKTVDMMVSNHQFSLVVRMIILKLYFLNSEILHSVCGW